MLRGSFTSTRSIHGMKILVTYRADQLRHSPLLSLVFAETIINIAAKKKQQPTTAYRTFMTTLQLGRINHRANTQGGLLATSGCSSAYPILRANRFRPELVS